MQQNGIAERPQDIADDAPQQDEAVQELRWGETQARAEFEELMEMLASRQDDVPYAH